MNKIRQKLKVLNLLELEKVKIAKIQREHLPPKNFHNFRKHFFTLSLISQLFIMLKMQQRSASQSELRNE